VDDEGLRLIVVDVIHAKGFRLGAWSCPAIETEMAPAMVRAGDDNVGSLVPGDVADSQSAQVQLKGRAESGGPAVNDLIRVEQWNQQGLTRRNGVTEADQKMAFRRSRKAFDVQGTWLPGRLVGGFLEVKPSESGIP